MSQNLALTGLSVSEFGLDWLIFWPRLAYLVTGLSRTAFLAAAAHELLARRVVHGIQLRVLPFLLSIHSVSALCSSEGSYSFVSHICRLERNKQEASALFTAFSCVFSHSSCFECSEVTADSGTR